MNKILFYISIFTLTIIASGQESTSHQLWGNLIFGFPQSKQLFLGLDIEPQGQIDGDQKYKSLDITPLMHYYPNSWIDLVAETLIGFTNQVDNTRTLEISPKIGIRLHLFNNFWEYMDTFEKVSMRRLGLATLIRFDFRNIWYTQGLGPENEVRLRVRLESILAINHINLDYDDTFYIKADAEYYYDLGEEISETFLVMTFYLQD